MSEVHEQPKYEVAEYKPSVAVLADLRKKYEKTVFDVSSTKGMVEARKARAEIREWRVGLEKVRKDAKSGLLEKGRKLDAEAKRLTAEFLSLEEPIDAQIHAEEDRKEVEKAAKEEAEKARVAGEGGDGEWMIDQLS